jgi:hypothetical protein
MTLPVGIMVVPTDLQFESNGEISETLLTLCGIGKFKMHHLASRALKAMNAACPFIEMATGTYRTYAQQVQLFMDRYSTTPIPGRPIKMWNGVPYWQKPNTALAAVPGTSNHGWGLAIDFAEQTDEDPAPEGVSKAMVDWLCANAGTYGFSAEAQSEPWHWRYIAGDNLPKAVIDFENPTGGISMLKPRYLRQKGYLNVWIVGDGYPCMDLSGELKASIDAELPGIEKIFFDNTPAFIGLCTMSGLNPHDPTQAIPGGSLTEF